MVRKIMRKEKIVFLSSKNENKITSIKELPKLDFVLTEKGEGYRIELDRLLAKHNIQIEPIIEFGNPETIINILNKGNFYSFLPYFCAKEKIKNNELYILQTDTPQIYQYTQLYYHRNKWINPQMEAFLAFTNDYFKN